MPAWSKRGKDAHSMNAGTTDDILACFRLLLGREPNAEEWPGHSSRAGEPLAEVVRSFLASKECQARGLLSTERLDDIQIANVNGKAVAARANDMEVGQHVLGGNWHGRTAGGQRQDRERGRPGDARRSSP